MKKILTITAIIATGLTAYAQTLVLSDNFDTGGITTNDLSFNLVARQVGTAATTGFTTSTNTSFLTSAGKIQTESWDYVTLDGNFVADLGASSFSVSMDGSSSVTNDDWMSMAVVTDTDGAANQSPMGFIAFGRDNPGDLVFLVFYDGNGTNAPAQVGITQDDLDANFIGFSVFDEHNYEFEAFALSTSNGTYNFKIDGKTMVGGLSYEFGDNTRRSVTLLSINSAVSVWDNLNISTIPDPEYVFFDDFNTSDTNSANADIDSRQAQGQIASTYSPHAGLYNITSNRLHQYTFAAFANLDAELAPHIDGKNFELSCKVAMQTDGTGGEWQSFYLFDETNAGGDTRADSRLGFWFFTKSAQADIVFVLYAGTGASPTPDLNITEAMLDAALGGTYDRKAEHTVTFVSHAGTGGTNTYDFVVDGASIMTGVPYYFDGAERHLGIVGIPPDSTTATGAFYDDIYLKVIKGNTYEDWVVEDTALTVGVNDARTDNPDFDSMDNLLEYALGGNPLVDDDASILPAADFGSSSIEYVFRRRSDHATRGLNYGITATADDLTLNTWTNYGGLFEVSSGTIDFAFDSVTNTVPAGGDIGFLNLEVEEL